MEQELAVCQKKFSEIKRGRELMHKKFGFVPHPDDPKKCNCAYCARDFEAVAEHAAEMEMELFSTTNQLKESEQLRLQLEAQNGELRKVLENHLIVEHMRGTSPYADSMQRFHHALSTTTPTPLLDKVKKALLIKSRYVATPDKIAVEEALTLLGSNQPA